MDSRLAHIIDRLDRIERILEADQQKTVSTIEAARILGRSRRWVADQCRDGKITSITKNPPYRIPLVQLLSKSH